MGVGFLMSNMMQDHDKNSATLLVGKSLRKKIMLIIYYRYCGSHVEMLKILATIVSPGHRVTDLNTFPEDTSIIRNDTYHIN